MSKSDLTARVLTAMCIALCGCEDGAVALGNSDDAGVSTPDGASGDSEGDADSTMETELPGVPVSDVTVSVDGDTASLCEAGTGCFEEPCDQPDECASGICVQHIGEKVCSKTCDADCPDGWTCTVVTDGSDSQYVCTSNFSHLCLPCVGAESCDGATPNACVHYADGVSFCGGSCDLSNPCPTGYACQEVETTSGAKSYQCVSESGVCHCSTLAIESSAATSCTWDNEHGSCEGVRVCTPLGLEPCDALEPGPEKCNGVDDDCDGLVDEDTCDDGNPCSEDACSEAEGCVHELLDSGECLDGDACTAADHCENGLCVGTPVKCEDDNPCTEDSCDGAGGCIYVALPGLCDDGDDCTVGDLCEDSVCTGSITLDCDDGNPCTDDSCSATGCLHAPNEAACDDGNACTKSSSCVAGACMASEATDCDDANPCTTDTCDLVTGCAHIDNALPCDDADACTQGDACHQGACESGGDILVCDDGNPCTDDACLAVGGCAFTANTLACDDGNPCTSASTCSASSCLADEATDCDDGNPCTLDGCDPAVGCTSAAHDQPCDDEDACTLGDACNEGACQAGATQAICDDQNPCTLDTCEPELGCVFVPTDVLCNDNNGCTTGDSCVEGNCIGLGSLACDDGNPCTLDTCESNGGCHHESIEGGCDDGSPCTVGDTCADGQCTSGDVISCDDGNVCTLDLCDQGDCVHVFNENPCDDGNACTESSVCQAGACVGTVATSCQDGDPCTDDGCDPTVGCVTAHNEAACSDDDLCTVGDQCVDGACVSGAIELTCNDGNTCTDDLCDADEGCTHTNNSEPCFDENVCTTNDTCEGGACASGPPMGCDDGKVCTENACDPVEGCVFPYNSAPCDDGNPCTSSSQCDQGACTGSLDVVCDDGDSCTADSCNVSAGCTHTPQSCCGDGITDPGEACDDGNDNNDDDCTNTCEAVLGYTMNGSFYVSNDTYEGDFNSGGGFCTALVGQTAFIAGNNASLGAFAGLTWQGNGSSYTTNYNCFGYTQTSGEGWGQYGQYGPCSVKRHVVCSTDPAYCNGYGQAFCHLWD